MAQRYFIGKDNDGHRFIIKAEYHAEWLNWLDLPQDCEEAWEVPSFARRIDGSLVTFEAPYIDGEPL